MDKNLTISLSLLLITIIACGALPTPQTTLEPATATATLPQPTQSPIPTNTPAPSATPVDTSTPIIEPQSETPQASVSFANDVLPIFENSCNKCHGIEQIKEGLDLRTYEGLLKGSFNGTVITPGDANDSFLVEQLLNGEMPKRGQKLTSEQIQTIIDWVNAGALNN